MEFKRYASIENSYRTKFLHKIAEQGHTGKQFVVQEKIHGANFSFWITKDEIRCGKRSGFIKENENFFNYERLWDKYEERLRNLFNSIPDAETVVVYGEIYGGGYPHDDVEKVAVSQVQNKVYYNPDQDFVAFDIKVNGHFLNVHEVVSRCTETDIPFVDTLFVGSLEECLNYSNEFPPIIPQLLGLPQIEGNMCEGTVVRPVETTFLWDGNRVILKNKNVKFAEKEMGKPKKPKEAPPALSEDAQKVYEELTSYVTENRLRNVLSKIGEITDKDFGKIMGLFTKDAIEDFIKDTDNSLNTLSKEEKKRVNKLVGQKSALLLRENFLNIIDGEF